MLSVGSGVTMAARFRANLKQLILNKGAQRGAPLTQREVAEESGVSLATISRWYRGEIDRIDADTVLRLTRYFACSINELIEVVE